MGIKFHCPNGHKLHVKSFLQGKKAICPKCGARVTVPLESDGNAAGGESSADYGAELPAIADEMASLSSLEQAATATATAQGPASLAAASSATAATPSATSGQTDPIAEAPSAAWYVRPATGGQFGPASGEIMRAWLNEGRVGASSMVWRAGWPEWRAASVVFPSLGKLLASPLQIAAAAPVGTAVPLPSGLTSGPLMPVGQIAAPAPALPAAGSKSMDTLPPVAQSMRKRRRRNDRMLMFSAVMLVISIILVIVLIIIWQRQTAEPATDASTAAEQASIEHHAPTTCWV